MARRQNIIAFMIIAGSFLFGITFVLQFRNQAEGTRHASYNSKPTLQAPPRVDDGLFHGQATAPKLENATLKAELGQAAWKVLHTTMAKFPDKPSQEDSDSLKAYLYLFARLYPCGDCATHFQAIMAKYPPQVSSRASAATWACFVHNEVNTSLQKPLFDCSKIGDFYDCGCAGDVDAKLDKYTPLELEKEGLTRGG